MALTYTQDQLQQIYDFKVNRGDPLKDDFQSWSSKVYSLEGDQYTPKGDVAYREAQDIWAAINRNTTPTTGGNTVATPTTPLPEGQVPIANKVTTTGTDSALTTNLAIQTPEQQLATRQKVMGNVSDPSASIPESAKQTYTPLADTADQFQTTEGKTVAVGPTPTAKEGQTATVQAPDQVAAQTIDPTLIGDATPVATAAQGAVDKLVDPITGQVSQEAIAQAAQGQLPPEATMGGQMDELLAGLEGGNIPQWARPAVEQVDAMLARRGLTRSSIGQQALFNAIIQSAAPIAQANAAAQERAFQLNLNNRQQAAMQNAAMYAGMDTANLNAAMTAQVENARSFLSINMQNLTNEQQTQLVNHQARLQTMFTDQAAQNASKQFNATSQQQTDQFMAQLGQQAQQFNASQANAMEQFNAGQTNAMITFGEQMAFQRESFNAQMYNVIEQSNVQWRRQMNQIDTAGQNAVNQANAINAFNLSNQALTLLWNDLRDSANWAFTASENDQQRQTSLAIAALSNESDKAKFNAEAWTSIGASVLKLLA